MRAALCGYQALHGSAAWLDLSERGKIAIRGPDRTRLIHALTTNDIRSLARNSGCYTFFLDAQGRVLADANAFCLADQILLDTEAEVRRTLLSHIEDLTIADDAFAIDLTSELLTFSVEGPEARRVLGLALPVLPAEPYELAESYFGRVAHVSVTGQPGWTVFASPDAHKTLVKAIENAGAVPATAEDARIVRIENAKPRYGEEITTRFIALETGQSHGISLQKGCYVGQEVVERLRSRNAVSRLLTPIHFDAGCWAGAGTKLRDDHGRAGEIVSAAFSPRFGRWVGFAYIRTDVLRRGASLTFDSGRVTIAGAFDRSARVPQFRDVDQHRQD